MKEWGEKGGSRPSVFLSLLLTVFLSVGLAGCTEAVSTSVASSTASSSSAETAVSYDENKNDDNTAQEVTPEPTQAVSDTPEPVQTSSSDEAGTTLTGAASAAFDLSAVPAYSGSPYAEINGNVPYFSGDDLTNVSYEQYGDLDSLGRCTVAEACIGQDLMPTEERGEIGEVRPTGWHTVKYDGIDGNYLYNRCHLIGYQLTGENANEKNLITGTRYMNVEGMEPFENMTADYIRETGNHVLYRVTPEFEGNNLLADGVLMEAESVEDNGASVQFCVFCYNVQPGITIDYATGDSSGPEFTGSDQSGQSSDGQASQATPTPEQLVQQADPSAAGTTYVLNTNTKKFHYPDCPSAAKIKDSNREEYTGSRDDLISQGYEPCKNCNP